MDFEGFFTSAGDKRCNEKASRFTSKVSHLFVNTCRHCFHSLDNFPLCISSFGGKDTLHINEEAMILAEGAVAPEFASPSLGIFDQISTTSMC